MKRTPTRCPACDGELMVTELSCRACPTQVSGEYRLPPMLRVPAEDQQFLLDFILASGSLKAMARQLGVSYPTVRNRLDNVIALLQEETEQ